MRSASDEALGLGHAPGTPGHEAVRRALEAAFAAGQVDAAPSLLMARSILQAMAEVCGHLVTELGRLAVTRLPKDSLPVDRLGVELHRKLDKVILLAERLPENPEDAPPAAAGQAGEVME